MSYTLSPDDLKQSSRASWLVGLAYFAFGAIWILLSDAMVAAVSTDPGWVHAAQRFKGLVYVAITTIGLVLLFRFGYRHLLAARQRATASDLRVQDLFMNHPMPMWVFDLQTLRFLTVNNAAVAVYGFSREEFLAMSAKDIRPPDQVASFLGALRSGPDGHGQPGVFQHRTKRGTTFFARITEHAIQYHGRPAMMVMAEDVTEEVQMQQAVQRQQEQFRQLHQSLGEVLWMASPDGRQLHYVSPAFADIYGRRVEELMANPAIWQEAVHPEDRALALTVQDLSPSQPALECQYRVVRPDGSIRWVVDRKKQILDASGQVVMLGGIAEDITARQEQDQALEQLNSRLESLVAERTRELEQANIELEAFSRTAAHDLKSPLNGIAGLSQLLRMKHGAVLDETGRRYIDQIERSARDMASLINDLLALSRAGSVELHRQWVDLRPLAESIVGELRMVEPSRNVEVRLPAAMTVYCDPGLMRSVLQNLIGNAWKFTSAEEQTVIEVDLHRADGETALTVSDNGPGFDRGEAPSVFHPFQRFHSQAQFQGTGLGLVTCQRIAHRHGGALEVKSAPGNGTCVTVRLPGPGKDSATSGADVSAGRVLQ